MTVSGTVVTVNGDQYRVNCSGNLSAWIPRLTSAAHFSVDSGALTMTPPGIGDEVLCWFPGEALCDGYIIGIAEA